jgi:hypothetical protein
LIAPFAVRKDDGTEHFHDTIAFLLSGAVLGQDGPQIMCGAADKNPKPVRYAVPRCRRSFVPRMVV